MHCVIVVGSVARGDYGPFSDIDLVVVADRADDETYARLKTIAADTLPMPADLLLLTPRELRTHASAGTRFHRELVRGLRVYEDELCKELLTQPRS